MLTNSRYAGRSVLRTKVRNDRVGRVEDVTLTGNGTWAPIIDGALFDVVATRLADPRRRTQVGTDRKHLGASLYRCGVCNTPVRSFSSGRYRCPNACVIRSRGPVDAYVLAVLRGRLARPDLADLLHVEDTDRARELAAEVDRLRARLTRIENDYDADVIDGRRYATAHAKVTAELGQALTEQARTNGHGAISGIVADPDPVAAFDAAPLMIQRAVLDVLVQVRLHPAPRGRRTFDPATVEITAAQP
jgi:hypothetical protein